MGARRGRLETLGVIRETLHQFREEIRVCTQAGPRQ